mmetsp:Transcript_1080/g.3676  ORF Transcript_1080/g.3676 Transcript_1080/m.3676 type:complete len:1341 (+) Transcript_1080:122-4144(+)|eukprot:CAMPEP_0206302798 /NCGR_PEP_ID=MMETSP0106_2-20121207/8907_1 /ASSEMBLY_ACC=CAM_ASM_000206 /TAXON_ID=81532 /ORGANISM="Acanthoeca-like sp., Strain 10tr" /LENGTH=1340 /DNA_ID=CAMNT_0053733573 /DNA_START=113 /DNA_END=4135 /DNA_ORIENTATION=+
MTAPIGCAGCCSKSRSGRPVGTSLALSAAMALAAAQRAPGAGCAFHCADNPCGGAFGVRTVALPLPSSPTDTTPTVGHGRTVDVTGRDITSFLPGAFDCWHFEFEQGGLLGVSLDHNPLGSVPNGSMFGRVDVLSLRNCSIVEVSAAHLAEYGGRRRALILSDNPISDVNGDLLSRVEADLLFIDLSRTLLNNFPSGLTEGFRGRALALAMQGNSVEALPSSAFAFDGDWLNVDVSHNLLAELAPGLLEGCNSTRVAINVGHNELTSLPGRLFSGGTGASPSSLILDARNNDISTLGPIFAGLEGGRVAGQTAAILRHNFIDADGLIAALGSYVNSSNPLLLDLEHNAIDELPDELFAGFSFQALRTSLRPAVDLRLAFNPIQNVSANLFKGAVLLTRVAIDISNPATGAIDFPSLIAFGESLDRGPPAFVWPGGLLVFSAAATGANAATAAAFRTFFTRRCPPGRVNYLECAGGCGPACNLTLVLSDNHFGEVRAAEFASVKATRLDVSRSNMTSISPMAFGYNRVLKELDLSGNALTVIPIGLQSALPELQSLNINDNEIRAVPLHDSRVPDGIASGRNPLTCDTLAPSATGCTCSPGYHLSTHCGYVRCTKQPDGCSPPLLFNGSSCDGAPWSSCVDVNTVLGRQYYDASVETFLPVSRCDTEFPSRSASKPKYQAAYQVMPATSTSDRVCSICSTCPSGYETVACTTIMNSRCVRPFRLSTWGIVTIMMFTMLVIGIVVLSYIMEEIKRRELAWTNLLYELTDSNLKTERVERERMGQAWDISEDDLVLGGKLGSGGHGNVYKANWGINTTAVKVLLSPLSNLSDSVSDAFDREVAFMKWVRHPNLITFFGAGIASDNRAFLVTELMTKGSLREVLVEEPAMLGWITRIQVAVDVAAAVRYLHYIGTVHCDLKPHNCLIDENLRAKVGDFGMAHIASTLLLQENTADFWSSDDEADDGTAPLDASFAHTITHSTGSWLWMAPEALSAREAKSYFPALDVYSFAVVLVEIWGRTPPWEGEIAAQGTEFYEEIKRRVTNGGRPALPQDPCPPQFRDLIDKCWAQMPAQRPSFDVIAAALSTMLDTMRFASKLHEEKLRSRLGDTVIGRLSGGMPHKEEKGTAARSSGLQKAASTKFVAPYARAVRDVPVKRFAGATEDPAANHAQGSFIDAKHDKKFVPIAIQSADFYDEADENVLSDDDSGDLAVHGWPQASDGPMARNCSDPLPDLSEEPTTAESDKGVWHQIAPVQHIRSPRLPRRPPHAEHLRGAKPAFGFPTHRWPAGGTARAETTQPVLVLPGSSVEEDTNGIMLSLDHPHKNGRGQETPNHGVRRLNESSL